MQIMEKHRERERATERKTMTIKEAGDRDWVRRAIEREGAREREREIKRET